MGLNGEQKSIIRELILRQMDEKFQTYVEREDMNKPFYFALFSKKSVYIASILQSTYTSFGSQWENIVEIIAKGNRDVKRFEKHYKLHGKITSEEQVVIADILFKLDRGGEKPNYETIKERIHNTKSSGIEKEINKIVDFFIEFNNGHEIYYENKTVKPNKNEMKAAKNDLLEILAMRLNEKKPELIDVAITMPYNTYFDKSFERWTTIKFFELGKDLLIGEEFWNSIGGDNTYNELIEIFQDVGKIISKKLDEFIAKIEKTNFNGIKYSKPKNIDDF